MIKVKRVVDNMIDIPKDTLGYRIRQVRGQLSQEDFGKLLNVSRSTVASWECNTNQPSIEVLLKIAKIGSVSMDWLTGNDSDSTYETETLYHDAGWQEFLKLAHAKSINPHRLIKIIKESLLLNSPNP